MIIVIIYFKETVPNIYLYLIEETDSQKLVNRITTIVCENNDIVEGNNKLYTLDNKTKLYNIHFKVLCNIWRYMIQ